MQARIGEVVEELIAGSAGELILIAPFIKVRPLRRLLSLHEGHSLRVYTRWLPTEVARGVSDLEALECIEEAGGRLYLVRELHAKAFIAEDVALIGSANITDAALGWSSHPNVETVVRVASSQDAVVDLLETLQQLATRANKEIQAAVAVAAAELDVDPDPLAERSLTLPPADATDTHGDGGDSHPSDDRDRPLAIWIPETSDPALFLSRHVKGIKMSRDAEVRAARDLHYLDVRPGTDETTFRSEMQSALTQTGFIAVITKALDTHHSEDAARSAFLTAAGIDPSDEFAEDYWQHAIGWLLFFFRDRYERVPVRSEVLPVQLDPEIYIGRY